MMTVGDSVPSGEPRANPYVASDVEAILVERGWLDISLRCEAQEWITLAVRLLGPHASDRAALGELVSLCFEYDARSILSAAATHAVLAREGAREVIRALALETIAAEPVDSDRFRMIVEAIKARVPYRSRLLFHPIRLTLTGRAGEGELDRVILLLDAAAHTLGLAPVKTVRRRILEFCSTLD